MRFHYPLVKRAKIKKTDHRGPCGNGNSHPPLVGMKSGVAALENSVNVNIHLPSDRSVDRIQSLNYYNTLILKQFMKSVQWCVGNGS